MLCLGVGGGCHRSPGWAVDMSLPEKQTDYVEQSPVAMLAELAGAEEPSIRGRALELLIHIERGEQRILWGQRALRDPNGWVQHQGIDVLCQHVDNPKVAALIDTYLAREDDLADPYAQGMAGFVLVQRGRKETIEVVKQGWRSRRSKAWRAAPFALAAALGGDGDATEFLSGVLRRGEIALDVPFILNVGNSGMTDLLPALVEGAEWVEPEMTLPYATARIALGDPAGEGVLRKALTSDDILLKMEALDYLSQLNHPAAMALLRRARGAPLEVVSWYGELTLLSRGEGSPERLLRAMRHEDRDIRHLAARFAGPLAGTGSRRHQRVARQVVLLGLEDQDAVVRAQALRAASLMSLRGQEERMAAYLKDEDRGVRMEAAAVMLGLEREEDNAGI